MRAAEPQIEWPFIVSDAFDPYLKWLGISPKDQPPHHYRLLGIDLFMDDPDVIETAADQKMIHLRTFQSGERVHLSQQLLNEISKAKVCLLNLENKAAYDANLKEKPAARKPVAKPLPVAKPIAAARPAAPPPSATREEGFNFSPPNPARSGRARNKQAAWQNPAVIGLSPWRSRSASVPNRRSPAESDR